jgi:hypothetical protein
MLQYVSYTSITNTPRRTETTFAKQSSWHFLGKQKKILSVSAVTMSSPPSASLHSPQREDYSPLHTLPFLYHFTDIHVFSVFDTRGWAANLLGILSVCPHGFRGLLLGFSAGIEWDHNAISQFIWQGSLLIETQSQLEESETRRKSISL